jgi:hypothetical protein
MSHDRACALLHYSISKSLGIEMTDKWRARTHKQVTEHEGVSVLWNEGEQTGREGTVNRPDIVIKNKKRENMLIDGCSSTTGQKCYAKGSRK